MLILRTGVPGAGKTLNTIKDIEEEYGKVKEGEAPRNIYYYNIPELDNSKLKANWIPFNDPENWYNYPDGSMFVIDEAQEIFPNDGKKDRPDKISKMERHRHQGHDIVLITQHPKLISTHVRKLVGRHIHINRPFGGQRLKKLIYEFCVDEPQQISNYSLAQVSNFKLDKKYFGVYKSATQHTHKFKMPRHYIVGIIAIIVLLSCIALALNSIWSLNEVEEKQNEQNTETTAGQLAQQDRKKHIDNALTSQLNTQKVKTLEEFMNENLPRIQDIPASAPRYDDINKPVVMPKPTCLMSTDPRRLKTAKRDGYPVGKVKGKTVMCQCYTQQGTKLNISLNGCYFYVENGYFDDTKPPTTSALSYHDGATARRDKINVTNKGNPNRLTLY